MEIISKSEAQKKALALREIPREVINEINAKIADSYAMGSSHMTYSKPENMKEVTWRALCDSLKAKGYTVKTESTQLDGQWVNIEL